MRVWTVDSFREGLEDRIGGEINVDFFLADRSETKILAISCVKRKTILAEDYDVRENSYVVKDLTVFDFQLNVHNERGIYLLR